MSCLKEERKPMVPLKILDIISRRRYVPNTQYYFTNRKHAIASGATPDSKVSPFLVPRSEKLLSFIKYSERKERVRHKDRLTLPLHLKDNLKAAQARGISTRLFVKEPPDDVRAVVEIHPEFYTVIEGRPLRSFDDIKVYLNNIRNYAMFRQQIGYRRDLIMKITQSMYTEEKAYEDIMENYKQHIKNFQQFLTEDYKKACAKVSMAEKIYNELLSKHSEYLGYVTKITILNNILFNLDAIRNVLKTYRTYLLFVAPITWRQVYDETLRDKVQSIQFESGAFSTSTDLPQDLDIDMMIQLAAIELKNPLPAHLYFKEPEEMMYLFRTMELQSREYLTQLANMDAPYRLLTDKIKQLKQATRQELDYFQYYIDRINDEIDRELFNEKHLQEKIFRILNGPFYETIASPDTLKLKICIEYVYEQVFGKCEEGHQNLHDPMKLLELMYEEYNLKLDYLDFKIVKRAQIDSFARDLKVMKNAHLAARELRAFAEMTNAMNKAFLPPAKFIRPKLKKTGNKTDAETTNSINETTTVKDAIKVKLTQVEKADLLNFTDWCEGKNPAPYLNQYYERVVPFLKQIPRE